jgi:hypothetical protein
VFGMVHTPEVEVIDRAVDALSGVDLAVLGDAEVSDALVDLRRVKARLAAVEASLVDAVETRRPWAADRFRTTANWLAASDNTRLDDARAEVRLARRLRTMPATRAALAAGDITADHADKLATLNGPLTAVAFAEAEAFLVGQARTMRWADFVRACGYWLREAREGDPDPAKADLDHRYVSLHDGLRGTGLLDGELTPVAKAAVRSELEHLENEMFETDWAAAQQIHGDATTTAHLARTPRQRRHDALVEMAERSATAANRAGRKRPRPLITVLVGYDAFAKVCELADGTLISPAIAAGLLDQAVIERIVFDGPSRVLDVGEARAFTGALRRALEVRDRHCRGPGCHEPADRCQVDHTWRHADGGPTTQVNGELKCPFHNRERERPRPRPVPPPSDRPDRPPQKPDTAEERAEYLELVRKRVRDRCLHDPELRWADGES